MLRSAIHAVRPGIDPAGYDRTGLVIDLDLEGVVGQIWRGFDPTRQPGLDMRSPAGMRA